MKTTVLKEFDVEDLLVEEIDALLGFFERRFQRGVLLDFLATRLLNVLDSTSYQDPESDEDNISVLIRHNDTLLKITKFDKDVDIVNKEFNDSQLLYIVRDFKTNMTANELHTLLKAGQHALSFFTEATLNVGYDSVKALADICLRDRLEQLIDSITPDDDFLDEQSKVEPIVQTNDT